MADHDYSKEIDALRKDLGSLQSDVRALTQAVADDARRTARGTVSDIAERAEGMADRGRNAYEAGVHEVKQEVGQHPLASLVTAAGVGFVIGSLMRR